MQDLLDPLAALITAHARPDLSTAVDGLLLSSVTDTAPDYSLTEPLLVVMARGGKRLLLGEQVYEYRAGEMLIVTTEVPVSGYFFDCGRASPALGVGWVLRPPVITELLLRGPGGPVRPAAHPAVSTGPADRDLLDAVLRMVRLLERPEDIEVLAPLIEREILWRLLRGPHAAALAQIGTAGSGLVHVNRTIRWIRENYAEPLRIADLAAMAGMSASAYHRHFRSITRMSPLQFQKRLRLQEARALLVAAGGGDIARVGHLVGYDSPTQFSREYRRLFGAPPGRDAASLVNRPVPAAAHLP